MIRQSFRSLESDHNPLLVFHLAVTTHFQGLLVQLLFKKGLRYHDCLLPWFSLHSVNFVFLIFVSFSLFIFVLFLFVSLCLLDAHMRCVKSLLFWPCVNHAVAALMWWLRCIFCWWLLRVQAVALDDRVKQANERANKILRNQ